MALTIDLLRHGRALPDDPRGDLERRLTEAGERTLERLGRRLAGEGWRPQRALSSPYRRALDSARILLRASHAALDLEALDALAPDNSPSETLGALEALGIFEGHVLLVGHQPLLGRLAAALTGAEHGFAPGGLLQIGCPQGPEPGTCQVLRAIEPDVDC